MRVLPVLVGRDVGQLAGRRREGVRLDRHGAVERDQRLLGHRLPEAMVEADLEVGGASGVDLLGVGRPLVVVECAARDVVGRRDDHAARVPPDPLRRDIGLVDRRVVLPGRPRDPVERELVDVPREVAGRGRAGPVAERRPEVVVRGHAVLDAGHVGGERVIGRRSPIGRRRAVHLLILVVVLGDGAERRRVVGGAPERARARTRRGRLRRAAAPGSRARRHDLVHRYLERGRDEAGGVGTGVDLATDQVLRGLAQHGRASGGLGDRVLDVAVDVDPDDRAREHDIDDGVLLGRAGTAAGRLGVRVGAQILVHGLGAIPADLVRGVGDEVTELHVRGLEGAELGQRSGDGRPTRDVRAAAEARERLLRANGRLAVGDQLEDGIRVAAERRRHAHRREQLGAVDIAVVDGLAGVRDGIREDRGPGGIAGRDAGRGTRRDRRRRRRAGRARRPRARRGRRGRGVVAAAGPDHDQDGRGEERETARPPEAHGCEVHGTGPPAVAAMATRPPATDGVPRLSHPTGAACARGSGASSLIEP